MINCDDGAIKISGVVSELVANYLQITDTLLQLQPEIALAVIYKNMSTLESATTKCNLDKLNFCEHIIDLCTRKGEDND